MLVSALLNVFLLTACGEMGEDPIEKSVNEGTPIQEPADNDDIAEEEIPDDEEQPPIQPDEILDPNNLVILVNKEYSIGEHVPGDLKTVEVPTVLENPEIRQLKEPAADALKEMFDAAEEEGIILHARSGYRSYQTQVQLFNSNVEKHGEEAASQFSSRPGHSEHQTGLAMDVTSESVNYQLVEAFGETEEGIWLQENAHLFGFIIRYPEGKSDITGYVYEPWHLRYLGNDLATLVYESGLSYEEFLYEWGIISEINK